MEVEAIPVVLTAALSSSTTLFVSGIARTGYRWFVQRFRGHQPEAWEKALENAECFLKELTTRVDKLEKAAQSDSRTSSRIERAMSDPDFSVVMQKALMSAARSSSQERHRLLARLLGERLLAGEESLELYASDIACDVLPRLSGKHVRCLALVALLFRIGPGRDLDNVPDSEIDAAWTHWLECHIAAVLPREPATWFDCAHLDSLGCISLRLAKMNSLDKLLSREARKKPRGDTWEHLKATELGRRLVESWDKTNLSSSEPTPAGLLIGTRAHDLLAGSESEMNW